MNQIMNSLSRLFCLLVLSVVASGNLYARIYWQETVRSIESTGYYHIEISPELAGLGLQTMMILDEENNEIPYFIRWSIPVKELEELDLYKLHSNVAKDSLNIIRINNEAGERISRFYILMKKADVKKQVSIRGSNDGQQWFTVKHQSTLANEYNTGVGVVDFPEGDYAFYEITITNKSGSPLNVTGVGRIKKSSIYGQFYDINTGSFKLDEDRESHKTILTFPEVNNPYYLSKLQLDIKNKEHYNREAVITSKGVRLKSFTISSRNENVFYFNNLLIDKGVSIEINNQDNTPLTFGAAWLFAPKCYLCAYLEKGTNYRVSTNGKLNKHYDIQDFTDEIPSFLPVVDTFKLSMVLPAPEPEQEKRFFEKPFFLWGVILLTGIILLWVCFRMLKQLRI